MPDLLEEDLRAIAPAPDEAFVRQLERKVETGFAAAPKPHKRRPLLLRPVAALAATVVLGTVVSIAAITQQSSTVEDGGGATSALSAPAAEEGAVGDRAAVAPGAQPRKVEQRTQLELRAGRDEFDDVTAGVLRVADATGSIVARSDVSESGGRGHATYDLRVPASQLPDALARLSRLGKVTSRSASTLDITAPYVSARDRLTDARDERRALLRALERATAEEERDRLDARLRDVRRRIAAAEADVRRIEARSNRARVDVTVRGTGEEGAWTPGDALDDAGRVLEVVLGVLVVAGAVLLPLALLGAGAAAVARLTRRRRRNAVLG